MNAHRSDLRSRGFTLVEMLLVIAIIGILAALLLPALAQAKARSHRIACINNLQQTGVAFHSFAHDHRGQFPMRVSQSEGGSREVADAAYDSAEAFHHAYRHFQALSNHLGSTRPLICPADDRVPAATFAAMRNENLSYLVTPNARLGDATSLLAGDRNLTRGFGEVRSVYRVDTNRPVQWAEGLHGLRGNLLFADGHVEKSDATRLGSGSDLAFQTTDLHLPTVPSTGATGAEKPGLLAADHSTPPPQKVGRTEKVSSTSSGAAIHAGQASSLSRPETAATAPTTVQSDTARGPETNLVTVQAIPAEESKPVAPKSGSWWWLLFVIAAIGAWMIRREWQRTAHLRHPDPRNRWARRHY